MVVFESLFYDSLDDYTNHPSAMVRKYAPQAMRDDIKVEQIQACPSELVGKCAPQAMLDDIKVSKTFALTECYV
jgi:hypothetical protein